MPSFCDAITTSPDKYWDIGVPPGTSNPRNPCAPGTAEAFAKHTVTAQLIVLIDPVVYHESSDKSEEALAHLLLRVCVEFELRSRGSFACPHGNYGQAKPGWAASEIA